MQLIYLMTLLAISLPATTCPAFAQQDHRDEDHHIAHLAGLSVEHAWVAATNDDHTLVYMTIDNDTADQVEILGAGTPLAHHAQLVGFTLQGAEVNYEPLPSVTVAAGNHLQLSPDGLAIALDGIERELEQGGEFEIELLTSLGHLDVQVQIEPRGATQHSHAGHAH